jgi:hypothetical protein
VLITLHKYFRGLFLGLLPDGNIIETWFQISIFTEILVCLFELKE